MSILEKSIDDESEEPLRIVSDVVCPACGCVCDDLTLTFRGNQLAGVSSGCRLGDEWFERHSKNEGPASCVRGIESSFDEAIRVASEILTEAKYPLIFGLSRSSTGGQRAAVTLADRIGAVVDTTASLCHGPSIIALQSVGESTCSLGETRNRADLVIFWGCNPGESHPRHAERYSVFPHGQFISSRDDRTVVMIGDAEEVHHWRLDQKGSLPDLFIPVERDRDFEIITELRAMLQDRFTSSNSFRSESSSRVHPQQSDLETLIRLMTGCRSGVIFFGLGLTDTEINKPRFSSQLGHANVEVLLKLVEELNRVTRFYARRMRIPGDVSGADSVLCWHTGFPFSVSLTRGFPRYNPGEYSANDLLSRMEPDACLFLGAESVPALSDSARNHLLQIPIIVIDYPNAVRTVSPTVHFQSAPYGLAEKGTIYRLDEIPLPLKKCQTSHLPSDETILNAMIRCVSSIKSWKT